MRKIERLHKIIGIYNADGGLIGEMKYLYDKLVNQKKCSLCSLTHENISQKNVWKQFTGKCLLPIETLHTNQIDEDLKIFTKHQLPCVVGVTGATTDKYTMLFNAVKLDSYRGNTQEFIMDLSKAISNYQQ